VPRHVQRQDVAVQALQIDLDAKVVSVTISGGTVGHKLGETLEDFLHRADTFLYEAKRNGRNQNVSESD